MVVLFLLYSTLGFFTVPYFVEKQLKQLANEQLSSQATLSGVSFNPYAIALDIEQLKLTDKDQTLWFSAENIHGNLNVWSSLTSHLSLSTVSIEKPFFLLKINQINQTPQIQYPQLADQNQEVHDQTSESSAFNLDIEDIHLSNGALLLDKNDGSKPIEISLKNIDFDNNQFTTTNINSQFNLSFDTENKARASISGSFNFSQMNLESQWSLENWSTTTLFQFISDTEGLFHGMKNTKGTINANGAIKYQKAQQALPTLFIDTFELSAFEINSPNESLPQLLLEQFTLSQVNIDPNQQSLVVENINSGQSLLSLHFDENYLPILPDMGSANSNSQTDDISTEDAQPWSFNIKSVNIKNDEITLIKNDHQQPVANGIKIENLTIENISNTNDQKMIADLHMQSAQQGDIKINTAIAMKTFDIDGNIQANDIDLATWQSWLPQHINIGIEKGFLSLQQKISLNQKGFISTGDYTFKDLHLLDANKQDFVMITTLNLAETEIDSIQKKITLNNITLDQAQTILQVTNDQQLNINNLISEETKSESQIKPQIDSEKTPEQTDKDWIIEIKQIELIDAQTELTDKSINPPYHTELSKLNGTIKGLSSDNLSKADVALDAALDIYTKIAISGQINPLSDHAYTDLSIDIKDLNLQNFSPYSGKFLGFPINRGKADFSFNYKLNQSVLQGMNDLTFKQLKFGQKNTSKDAVDLPLKLAVSLLTDSNGVMKIDLPVKGNIDDPEFSYGGLVFKAFFKLITGIVASPFKLLGKLIPGGADLDLSGIQFVPGTLTLKAQEQEKLVAMKQIIEKRPTLLLELTGISNNTSDKKALQEQSLLTKLNLTTPIDFNDIDTQQSIKTYYLSVMNEQQWQNLENKATSAEQVIDVLMLSEQAWSVLLKQQNIDDQFNLLSKKRAEFIQQQLVDEHAIPIDKVFIKSGQNTDKKTPQVQFGIGG